MEAVVVERLEEKKEKLRKELGFRSKEEFEEWLINWLEDFIRDLKDAEKDRAPLFKKEIKFKLKDSFIAISATRLKEDLVMQFTDTVVELEAKLGEDVAILNFKLEDGGHLTIDFWGDSRKILAKLFS